MSKKIYRVMIELQAPIGDYDYVTGDNGIAYIKDFEDIESALEDYYDVVKLMIIVIMLEATSRL